jgi:hypothetical protein
MDADFAFSLCRTREEWEEENGAFDEIAESLEQKDGPDNPSRPN